MSNSFKILVLAGGLAALTMPAQAAVRFGTRVYVGPVYRQPWGYGPNWAYGYPVYPAARVYVSPPTHAHQGQIKVDTKEKDDPVFLDGAYAGTVKDVNSEWLPEGVHNLEIHLVNGQKVDERVFVPAGKSVHVNPSLMTPAKS